MPAALNLSDEVVKMRAEVKRVKVLIIRKLTRQIVALQKKKGAAADLEKNQRRAARLLEEIHLLKALAPDSITKAALQSDISFEKVCQNKDSTLSERATARIATHPEFSKRIQSIKNAVEAFKAERTSDKKKGKKSRDDDQLERESKLDSDDEGGSEYDDDGAVDTNDEDDDYDPDDEEEEEGEEEEEEGSSQTVQKADEEKLKEPTKQNQDPVTVKESSSETGSTPAEVVRMRKEVKKLRVLIIRNLTQQITGLKKAKAEESELKGNMECVARMQKEVQALRMLLPDHVTSRALKGSIDMEKVFQDPESSAIERAMARIATHPRFVKKLQAIRQAIEEENIKAARAGKENKDHSEMMKAEDSDSDGEVEEDVARDNSNDDDNQGGNDDKEKEKIKEISPALKVIPRSNVGKPAEDTKLASTKEESKGGKPEKAARTPANPKPSSKPAVKAVQSLPPKSKDAAPPLRPVTKPDTKKPENRKDKEESDLSDSEEEEKEYFDDSTEERFHKQSSYSEQSDDDDFFLGQVSKLKKRKSDAAPRKEKSDNPDKARDKEASETPQFKMQSIFCSTLSKSSSSSQKLKQSSPNTPGFQKRLQSDEKPWVKSQGFGREKRPPGFQNRMPGSRESAKHKGPGGDKTGKPAFERKNMPSNKAGKHSQQALHPSWEASRKRKEQQAQITAFQGKKIKFDDDDY